ncbi:MAG TPA: hypothetical protein VGI56_09350 [Galbitalea sp.]
MTGAALVVVCCLCLSGCSIFGLIGTKHRQVDYPRWQDAPHRGGSQTALPAFVPHDATDIYLRTLLDGTGATLTFTSPDPLSSELCRPGELTGSPRLLSTWWPNEKPPDTGMVCSPGWRVFVDEGVTYAWLDKS